MICTWKVWKGHTGVKFTAQWLLHQLIVASFLNAFYQYAPFICGSRLPGLLSEHGLGEQSNGYLAFLRLVGTTYFKKHLSALGVRHTRAVVPLHYYSNNTPEQLFHSITTATTQDEQHKTWYKEIRTIISDRITNEEERPPSHTAVWRHWLRSCWVCQMWKNSPNDQLYRDLSPPEQSGRERDENGEYSVDWESPEACKQAQETIEFLIKGCSCRKGCHTRQCGCRKKG